MTRDIERAHSNAPGLPWMLEFRSSDGFILATVCVAIFTFLFYHLVFEKGREFQIMKWWTSFIFAVFGAAILIGSPICGWIADRSSNRSVTYFAGLFILAGATLLFGFAKAAWLLVVSRLLQGLSAAVVYTVGLALLVDTVGRESIGQWMGTALSSSSFGLIISPLLGGIVYAKAGYVAVFAMSMSLIVVDIVLRMFMIEKRVAEGYLAKIVTTRAPNSHAYGTFADEQRYDRNNYDSNSPAVPGSSSDQTLTDGEEDTLLTTARRTAKGKANSGRLSLPPVVTLLTSPRLLAALYGIFVNVSILATFDGVLALFVKTTFHWDSLSAGLIFLCIAIPALAGPLVGSLSDRLGPRWITVSGCGLTAIPLILMRLVENDSKEHQILLCCLLFACGCTLILIVAPVAADLSVVVEEKEEEQPGIFGPGGAYAQAFALFNCSMAAATLFGPVFAGALVQNYGWKAMTLAMGIFSLTGAIPSEAQFSARNKGDK
ncbi:putative MFS-type transporter [Hyphodiscus hymeniophilus]|uniref:MFS-type transporter n=1 Tax=Hyphodiscus hymeniophilus TaxID=353542 RepID=A0A9P6VI01_9HELO|nr:putative MFS-type transporter [Hyphodiscus hymeniophilus]